MTSRFKCAVRAAVAAVALAVGQPAAAGNESRATAWSRHVLDAEHHRVWVLNAAGVTVYDAISGKAVRVLLPGWHYAGSPYGCLPAITLGPKGEALISSDVVPVLWRVSRDPLQVTRHELRLDADNDKDIGFTLIAHSPSDGGFVAASGPHGSVWRIDRELRNARKMMRRVPRGLGCASHASQ